MPAATPLLTIPSESEGSAAFKERVSKLVSLDTTHIYIDTSFLMWVTKVGASSRKELFDWLRRDWSSRVHIPIWAAHEYLRHHIAGTILKELSERTNEVANFVGRTYSYFRPFVDEPIGRGAEDPATLRASTRDALNALERLTKVTRQWHGSYQKHAAEVIAFINGHVPDKTELYSYFPTLGALGSARYAGSVPPGFQDRRKHGDNAKDVSSPSGEPPAGSNRFGDLIFWKEVLDHAKAAKANCIIILTNDRKNDWQIGRGDVADIDPELLSLRRSWKPVPRVHPMLALEAKIIADVDEVVLLDSPYLAVLLRQLALDDVRSFADVAIVPEGTRPESEEERRAKALEQRRTEDAAGTKAAAAESGVRFLDDPRVQFTPGALRRALYESRNSITEEETALLEQLRAGVESSQPIGNVVTGASLDGFDHKQIVRLARELHDRVLAGAPGFGEALSDLVSLIDEFPPHTSGCFYLGFLASMYLVREDNSARLPPRSPVADLLFARQAAAYAVLPMAELFKRVEDSERRPLYMPSVDQIPVSAVFDIEPDTDLIDQLRSLRVAGVEVLTPAQQDSALKLSTLFPEQTADTKSIIAKVCELYAIPRSQVQVADEIARTYSFTPTTGFKRPDSVFILKEEPGGN